MSAPRLAVALIRRAAPRDRADDLLGDLEEVHARRVASRGRRVAGFVTWVEAIGIAVALIGVRFQRGGVGELFSPGELRLAVRLIGRHPFMSLTSVLALAVGIAIATAGFTVLNSLLNPTVPLADADRVVEIGLLEGGSGREVALPPGAYRTWREGAEGLKYLAAVRNRKMNLRYQSGEVELIDGAEITPATFEALPYAPVIGRPLTAADGIPGADPVVVIREGLWRRQFGAAAGAIGIRVDVNGTERTLVGVLPDSARFPAAPDLWIPLAPAELDATGSPALRGVALNGFLRQGASAEELEARMTALLVDLPSVRGRERELQVRVRGVGELESAALPGGLMLAVLGALLVVVASNVGNLVVARNAVRRQELAVRSALGAGRARIVVQLTLEVLVMVTIAAMLGLVVSHALLNGLAGGEADDLPPWVDFTFNPRIALFVVVLTGLATLFAGLLPALQATRGDLGASLHAGPGASLRAAFGRRNDLAIVVQIALSVGVLGAAAMIHLGWAGAYASRLPEVPLDRVLTARVTLAGHPEAPEHDVLSSEVARSRRGAIVDALGELPEVVHVGAGTHVPGMDAPIVRFEIEGDARRAPEGYPTARIGPGYLLALEVEPVAGRGFLPADYQQSAVPVALVNAPFVDRHLNGRNPIGLRLRPLAPDGTRGPWREIVGVLPDLGMSAADPERNGGIYLPLAAEAGFWVFLNSAVPPRSLADRLQRTAYATVPDASVDAATVLRERIDVRRRVFLAMGSVVTSVGAMVLVLSLTAIYAILSFEVTRRTPEFGIRAALGATRAQIARPVFRRVARYVVVGVLLGAGFGSVLIGLARGLFVMRFPPTGPWLFAALAVGVAVAALAAGWVPMRRALGVDPMRALRAE